MRRDSAWYNRYSTDDYLKQSPFYFQGDEQQEQETNNFLYKKKIYFGETKYTEGWFNTQSINLAKEDFDLSKP